MPSIAVLGAGVIGLSTAINIQTLIPEAEVTVIADKFEKETTSTGAGAIFLVTTNGTPGVPTEKLRNWTKTSWDYLSGMAQSSLSKVTGVQVISGYLFQHNPIERPLYADFVYTYRDLTPKEMTQLCKDHYKYGSQITTIIVDMSIYLPWLMAKVKANGGTVIEHRVSDLNELQNRYDVIVNCTGVGSRFLFDDKSVYPIRGQMIKVLAPWIKNFIFTDDFAYILPNTSHVMLGTTKQKHDYNMEAVPTDRNGILERCQRVWPAVKGAEIVEDWVGLRPAREPIRLEKETIRTRRGPLKVVHNYGHGSNGVALSWGTAVETAKLVQQLLIPNHKM